MPARILIFPLAMISAVHAQPPARGTIEGNVSDAITGLPISGVQVSAFASSMTAPYASAVSDQAGHYTIKVEGGSFSISTSKQGYGQDDLTKSHRVALMPGAAVKGVDFRLYPDSVLAGRVLNEDRNPVIGAAVGLWTKQFRHGQPFFEQSEEVATGESGEFRFKGLREGQYYFGARPKKLTAAKKKPESKTRLQDMMTFYPNALSIDLAAPIALRRGETRDGADIVLEKGSAYCVRAALSGSLQMVPFITVVEVSTGLRTNVLAGNVHDDSAFEICGLTPGAYSMYALKPGSSGRIEDLESLDASFEIRDQDIDLGVLEPAPKREIYAAVVIADPGPEDRLPQHMQLTLQGIQSIMTMSIAAAAGPSKSPFSLLEDSWVKLQLPAGFYVKQMIINGLDITQQPIPAGVGGDLRIVVGADGPVVSGQAVDKDSLPVSDAWVVLAPSDPRAAAVQSAQSDQRGQFSFSGMPPGDYRILAVSELSSGEAENPDFLRSHATDGERLTLDARERKSIAVSVGK